MGQEVAVTKGVSHRNSTQNKLLFLLASMASKRKYEFKQKLPEDFECPVCLDAVYDAKETTCCGHHLCKSCSDRLTAGARPCPHCRASPLATQDSQFMRRKLRQLHIYCINKDCSTDTQCKRYPTGEEYRMTTQ